MSCWLDGCILTESHGHPVVDRGCSQCVEFGRKNPHIVGNELPPPGPWHCVTCNRHEDVWQRTDTCWKCYEAAHPAREDDEELDEPEPQSGTEPAQEPAPEPLVPPAAPEEPKVRAKRQPKAAKALRATKRAK